MSQQVAELELACKSDGLARGSDKLREFEKQAERTERASDALGKKVDTLSGLATKLAGAFALIKLGDLVKESALLAARYETLGVVMRTVGEAAGYSKTQTDRLAASLEKQGISKMESRNQLSRFALANMPLERAPELAKIAQGAAVIQGINSSEAFSRLTHGIIGGQTEIIRTMGIMVDFEGELERVQHATGKTAMEFTKAEKQAMNLNAVLRAASNATDVYEEAMTTTGKFLTSMQRFWDNFKIFLGESFGAGLTDIVVTTTKTIQEMTEYVQRSDVKERLSGIGTTAANTMKTIVEVGRTVNDIFMRGLELWNGLPSYIQEIGILGVLVGGVKFKTVMALVAGAASVIDSFGKISTVQDAVKSGKLSKSEVEWTDRKKFNQQVQSLRDDENRDANIAKANKRAEAMIQEQEKQERLAIDSERKAAEGRLRLKKEEALERERIAKQVGARVLAAQREFVSAMADLANQEAKATGDPVRIAQVAAEGKRAAALQDLKAKQASLDLTSAEKGVAKQVYEARLQAIDQEEALAVRRGRVEQAARDVEFNNQRASLVGLESYLQKRLELQQRYDEAMASPKPGTGGIEAFEEEQRKLLELGNKMAEHNFAISRRRATESAAATTSDLDVKIAEMREKAAGQGFGPRAFDLGAQRASQAVVQEAQNKKALLELNNQLAQLADDKLTKEIQATTAAEMGDEVSRSAAQADIDALVERINRMTELVRVTEDFQVKQRRATEESYTASGGISKALATYATDAENSGKLAESAITNAFSTAETSMASFLSKGEYTFNSLKNLFTGVADSIVNDLMKIFVKQQLLGPLARMMGMGGETTAGASFLEGLGGKVSSGWSSFTSLFGFAEGGSFMVGGNGGVDSQLVQFKASPNERVTIETPEQQSRVGRVRDIHFHISTPDANSFRQSQNQIYAEANRRIQQSARRA